MSKETTIEKLDFETIEHEHIPFTLIHTKVVQTITDHFAGMIWIYLQSLPKDWKINKKHLQNHFKIGEDKLKKHLAYLNRTKLIEYIRNRGKEGRLGKIHIRILNGTQFDPNAIKATGVKTHLVDSHTTSEYPPLTNTIEDLTNDNKDLREGESTASPSQGVSLELIDQENLLSILLPEKYIKIQSLMNEECLADPKCNESFKTKFDKVDVTIKEMLNECVMFYALKPEPRYVSPNRFNGWIKREHIDIYDKKPDTLAHKLWRDLTEEERALIADYNHAEKHPGINMNMSELKKQQARELISILKSTQYIRVL